MVDENVTEPGRGRAAGPGPDPVAPSQEAPAALPAEAAAMHPVVRGIGRASAAVSAVAVLCLFVIMLVEAGARYLLSEPLGWNVSAVERLMMPGMVFLALPWMYVCAGHVSAGMVYSRLAPRLRAAARIIAFTCVVVAAALLFAGGANGAFHSLVLGDAPPPASAEVPIPTWTWLTIQPLGALGLLVVALIDAPRFLRDGELADDEEGHMP
ncbi:TRAP transporter small permease [uncultured Brevibacterium sp.]|uniref:TRAP transporter small permease n=1 Tax=uncultured Brevibacterium sp. TaxID=189678 RepID=UPI0025CE1974|nr:TRAP transporter small permease [uncultured Brevibacterium sp.]